MSTTWKAMGEVGLGETILVGGDRVTVRSIDRPPGRSGRVDVRVIDERGGDFWMYSVRQDWPVQVA